MGRQTEKEAAYLKTLVKCWDAIDGSHEQGVSEINEELAREHDNILCTVWSALQDHERAIRAHKDKR